MLNRVYYNFYNVKKKMFFKCYNAYKSVKMVEKAVIFFFNVEIRSLPKLVPPCVASVQESSILLLIAHKALLVHPTEDGWVQNLHHLVDRYFG